MHKLNTILYILLDAWIYNMFLYLNYLRYIARCMNIQYVLIHVHAYLYVCMNILHVHASIWCIMMSHYVSIVFVNCSEYIVLPWKPFFWSKDVALGKPSLSEKICFQEMNTHTTRQNGAWRVTRVMKHLALVQLSNVPNIGLFTNSGAQTVPTKNTLFLLRYRHMTMKIPVCS